VWGNVFHCTVYKYACSVNHLHSLDGATFDVAIAKSFWPFDDVSAARSINSHTCDVLSLFHHEIVLQNRQKINMKYAGRKKNAKYTKYSYLDNTDECLFF